MKRVPLAHAHLGAPLLCVPARPSARLPACMPGRPAGRSCHPAGCSGAALVAGAAVLRVGGARARRNKLDRRTQRAPLANLAKVEPSIQCTGGNGFCDCKHMSGINFAPFCSLDESAKNTEEEAFLPKLCHYHQSAGRSYRNTIINITIVIIIFCLLVGPSSSPVGFDPAGACRTSSCSPSSRSDVSRAKLRRPRSLSACVRASVTNSVRRRRRHLVAGRQPFGSR